MAGVNRLFDPTGRHFLLASLPENAADSFENRADQTWSLHFGAESLREFDQSDGSRILGIVEDRLWTGDASVPRQMHR